MKASDIHNFKELSKEQDGANPKRANKGRYCTGKATKPVGKTLSATGNSVKKIEKNGHSDLSGAFKLSELRKEAKKLGVKKVMQLELTALELAIKEAKSKPAANAEPVPEQVEEIAQLKAQIKEKGGNIPKGRASVDKLKQALNELD
jgi:hypothetical protein